MRDDILQARRLLAYLGWTYGMPTTRGNSAGWSDMVPTSSTRPLRDVATGEALEKARAYGLDLDAPDRGRLKVTAPTDSNYFRGMTPLVWADLQVQHLDEGHEVQWEGDLPPLPEADVLGALRDNAEHRQVLHSTRVAAIQQARGRHSAEDIADAAGLSRQGVYRVYRQSPPAVTLPEGDGLQIIRDTIRAIEHADAQRVELMRQARREGVPASAIAHFAGVSDRTVRDLTATVVP